ncbi:hypothetical protein [Chryseobacterium luquanense]|uniref:DUF3822 family protein n=1 Tax=Chryseobacterium luquanense TaxID=2983766 RepID=A0ABT3Y7P1_9FLAO|nr:hypothetical protein [Chryseobacterium luquanense]MCX8534122.1 hypothetical protein [Chryseobacterium luquanense]
MNHPMYKIEIKAFLCSIEIEVNDIPCFSYYNEPQIATDIPINNLLFNSGRQNVKFRITPLFENKTFNKESKIELNIYVKDANDFYLKKQLIKSYTNNETLQEKSFFESALVFEAILPYTIEHSFINYSFFSESKDHLLLEVYKQYEILAAFIIKNDLKNYNDFTKIRFNDFATAHYLDEIKRNYYLNKALDSFEGHNLNLISIREYTLKFCYNGKLVYLEKMRNSPGLILEDVNSNEEQLHFIESAIFYRNNAGKLLLFR